MVPEPKITTLADLQRRKKQVRMETELAKRELAHTLGTTRTNLGSYLLKGVARPAGGAVAGLAILSSLLSGSNKQPVIKETKVIHEYPDGRPYKKGRRPRRRSRAKTLTTLIGIGRLLVPIIQAIIGSAQANRAKKAAKTAKRAAVQTSV
jgi:hypothetical protein